MDKKLNKRLIPERDLSSLFVVLLVLLVLFMLEIVSAASKCPANQANVGPYRKLIITPSEAYKRVVGKPFTIQVVRVENRIETPIPATVIIEKLDDAGVRVVQSWPSFSKNARDVVTFTPETPGWYRITTTVTNPTKVQIFATEQIPAGAPQVVCGNKKCESGETPENCPRDCVVCGDGFCEGDEDKVTCPDDCMICGDGVCDDAEIGANKCYCEVDCLVCGDGICRAEYGENCPKDCPWQVKRTEENKGIIDFLVKNWVAIIVGLAVLFLLIKRGAVADGLSALRDRFGGGGRSSLGSAGERKPKKAVAGEVERKGLIEAREEKYTEMTLDSTEISDLIAELMDTGVSEKRVIAKLKEFGVGDNEAKELVERAKRMRD